MRRSVLAAMLVAALAPAPARAADDLSLHVTRVEERAGPFQGMVALWLFLDPHSRAAFAAWTRRHVGQGVRLLIEGEMLVEARLMSPIRDGTIVLQSGAGQRRGAIEMVLSHAKGDVTATAVP